VSGAIQAGPAGSVVDAERAELAELEQQLEGHVRNAIDFVALYQLEQLLWGLLDQRGIDDEQGELAKALLVDAVIRAARDPASYFPIRPPPGITEAEARAVEVEDACPFCQVEVTQAAYDADPANIAAEAAEAAELEALWAPQARAWREKHAEVLARRGLAVRPPPVRD